MKRSKSSAQRLRFCLPGGIKDASAQESHPQHLTIAPRPKRNRVVPIGEALQEILATHSPERTEPWFFPSPRGRRWDPDNFSQDLREINRAHSLSCGEKHQKGGQETRRKGGHLCPRQ